MAMQGRYDFLDQDSVIFGVPASQAVSELAHSEGAERVFLVTSKTLSRQTDEIDRIKQALGKRFVGLFDECVAHVPRESVLRAAGVVQDANPDLLVTVGGGTPIDTAKVLQICLAEGVTQENELDEYRIRVLEDGARHVPSVRPSPVRQVVVPTTLSGAEFSNLGGCSDPVRKVKDLYTGRDIGAKSVILDPALTLHTPEWLWLSTGVRAIDHAVETVCSRKPQPFTDATSLYGLKMLASSLIKTKNSPADLQARLDSQLGVWLASTGLGRVEWGASHGIGHQLGAVAAVPHGYTSCVMLHNVLRYNKSFNADRQNLVAQALGSDRDDAADQIESLVRSLGMPTKLSELGVKREHFDAIARGGMENMMVRSNPRPIKHPDDIIEILEAAF